MEAANAVDAPVIIQASRGARSYANDVMLKHMMDAVTEIPAHPGLRASRSRQRARHLHDGDPGRLHLGDDGRIAQGRRQDAGRLGLQRQGHPHGRGDGPSRRHLGGGRARRARLPRERRGRGRGRPRSRRQAQPRPAPHQPRRGREVRGGDEGRRARHRDGHLARRLQVHPQADGAILAMHVIEEIHAKLPNMHLDARPRCRRTCRTSSTSTAAR